MNRLRGNLDATLDRVVSEGTTVIVKRDAGPDVAILRASELAGLLETAYLLSTPNNKKRLIDALRSSNGKAGHTRTKGLSKERLGPSGR